MDYPEIDATGELICTRSGSSMAAMLEQLPAGHALLIDLPPTVPSWWDGSQWVVKPAQPSEHCTWDGVAKAWVDPRALADLRAARWAEIKRVRAVAEVAPLAVAGRVYDADAESQRRIAGAVQLAVIAPPGWSIDWTLADNSVATLTAADVIAVGVALGAQVSAAHAVARVLRAQIDTAADAAAINAIQWPAT